MSNGARLTAVIVVVAVAAIGLYFALTSPSQPSPSAATADSLTQPLPAEGLGELAGSSSATASTGTTPSVPPADAFGTPSGTLAPAGASAASIGGSGASAAPSTVALGPSSASPNGARPTGSAMQPSAPAGPGATNAGDPTAWKTAPEPAAPTPSAFKEYTIQSGDTLEAIARAELGSGQKWNSIVAANPGLNPKQLKVGQKIRIPAGGQAASTPATETMKSADTGNTYTVQKGDTLFGIARKLYGSGSDAEVRRIVDANGGILKSKETPLKPGMKLAIPAKR